MKVTVLGSSGQIGAYLVEYLSAKVTMSRHLILLGIMVKI